MRIVKLPRCLRTRSRLAGCPALSAAPKDGILRSLLERHRGPLTPSNRFLQSGGHLQDEPTACRRPYGRDFSFVSPRGREIPASASRSPGAGPGAGLRPRSAPRGSLGVARALPLEMRIAASARRATVVTTAGGQ